jgi:transcription antitermination factor NusG
LKSFSILAAQPAPSAAAGNSVAVSHRRFHAIEMLTPLFPAYCFTRIEMQCHAIRQCPGVIRPVTIGDDEPVHVPDEVIDALRKRERNGAIDLPTRRGPQAPKIGDRVKIVFGLFAGHSGVFTKVSRQQVGVLLLMFKAQRQVRLQRGAVELV